MADNKDNQSVPQSGSTPAPNKAQAEFDKYRTRMQGGASAGSGPHPDGPSWAVPPSVTMLPRYADEAAAASGSLADSIGTTLRLGLDVINAALAGGTRLLGGFAGAYGHEDCGCESCCEPSCCEPDCCGCESCHPGVGNCC
ncbi:MAG TPA: hypothetical protein VHV26_06575 [Rhizomicrobium sp.]|jgi:hypothetical protein|nr:hypothetical protein [Rhizomicrobium sp.]